MAQEQYSATQIATIVDVKPSTLRKYASLLEEEGYIFEKDGHGRRLYSAMDLKAFEMLIAQSSNGAMSLNDSARTVYYWSKDPDRAHDDTENVAPQRRDDSATPSVLNQDLKPLMSILENQHYTIEHMGQQMEKQAEELSAMRSAMQQVFEQQGKQMDSLRQEMQQLIQLQEIAELPEPESVRMEKQVEEMSAMRSAMQSTIEQQTKEISAMRGDMQRLIEQQEAAAALPEHEMVQSELPRGFFARLFSKKG